MERMVAKIHILLVDDEPDYVEPMAFWLRTKGYDVSIAPNGEEGIKAIKEKDPHIVFLDLKMPIMDGIETLKHIREFNKELPVIMVTAYPEQDKLQEAQKLGISGFFAKDVDFEELRNTIEFTLKTYKKVWKQP